MSAVGFSFKNVSDVYSKKPIVILSLYLNNPYEIYESTVHKSKVLFVVDKIISLQFLLSKVGRKVEGNFVVLDNCENLELFKIKCLDCVMHKNMSMKVVYNGDIDNLMTDKETIFSKKLLSHYKRNKSYRSVSTMLNALKHKDKKITFYDLVKNFEKSCEEHKVKNIKNAKELFIRAFVNNQPYEKLKELGSFAEKYIPKLKKASNDGSNNRSIAAFQDMMYFLTPQEIVLSEDGGDEELIQFLLDNWNPNPSKKKEVIFPFNKKPLSKKIKSKKKIKKWENKKHIIPQFIVTRRLHSDKPKFGSKIINFNDINIPTLESGIYSIKKLANFLNIEPKNAKVIGGLNSDNKLVCRKGEFISLFDSKNNTFNYIRIL